MRKNARTIICLALSLAMVFAFMPVRVVHAAGTTIDNIPVVGHDAQNNEYQLKPNATFALDTATITKSDIEDREFHIILENVTYDWENNRNQRMDDDYELGLSYNPYIFCAEPGSLISDEGYTGLLTVPVPEGYDPTTAKVFEIYDMVNEPDETKSPVSSYTANTITVKAKMKYWETTTNIQDGNGGFVMIGGFSSHIRVEFKKQVDISTLKDKASLAPSTSEYTGSAIEPAVTITGLTKDKDYTVSYSGNINAGAAKATVTGKGLYKGTIELPFTITPMPIDKKKEAASLPATEFDYTGKAIEPEVTITGLTKGTDFTVSYGQNIDPGTATVTITGMGNYNGSFTKDFTINKASETSLTDNKTGARYAILTKGSVFEATYEAPKSKDEKTASIPDDVTLPDGSKAKVTIIANGAFKGNTKLTSAKIGNNVKTVGNNAFKDCSKLKSLKFGNKIEKIGAGAVSNCKSLTSVTIPASTKTIGKNAFNGNEKLKTLTINCKNLKSVGKGAIKNINPKATIKLKGTAKQKKAAEKLITNKNTGYKKSMKIKK